MALPRKGDPRRPLYLAASSMRLLAIIFLLFGSCAILPLLQRGGLPRRGAPLVSASVFLIYIVPGVAYLLFSIFLKRRRFWAVMGALILASIQLLLTLLAAISFSIFIMMRSSQNTGMMGTTGIEKAAPAIILGLVALALVALALAQLIYHLALSFEAIKHVPIEEQRGFEPLMTPPLDPPPPVDGAAGPPTLQ